MMTGVKMMTDDVTQLMIPLRKTWNQLNILDSDAGMEKEM